MSEPNNRDTVVKMMKVLMLPTLANTRLYYHNHDKMLGSSTTPAANCHTWENQNLLILSDRDIEDGDSVYHPTYGIGNAWKAKDGKILISYEHDGEYNLANDSVNLYVNFTRQMKIEAGIAGGGKNTLKVPYYLISEYAKRNGAMEEVGVLMQVHARADNLVPDMLYTVVANEGKEICINI